MSESDDFSAGGSDDDVFSYGATPKKAAPAKKSVPAAKKADPPAKKPKAAPKKKKAKKDSDDDEDEDDFDDDAMDLDDDAGTQKSTVTTKDGGKKTIEEIYQKLEQREHVLKRPDMYIGAPLKTEEEQWVMDEWGKLVFRKIAYSPGLYKIFDEILVNAADNYQRDTSMKTIRVEIDEKKGQISVYNDGSGIHVEIHQKHKVWVPELIFGEMLAGTNFNDNEVRVVGGRNGLGAKLANIFSKEFIVETASGKHNKKQFRQVFHDNMSRRDAAEITSCKATDNWTRITFTPELKRFGMATLEADTIALMRKRVWDVAGCNSSLKVYFNGTHIELKDFAAYVRMFVISAFPAREATLDKVPVEVIYDADERKRWEVAVTVSEGEARQVSFVNSICTTSGGTHVSHVQEKLVKHLTGPIEKKLKGVALKPGFIRNNMWVFVNALINDPTFNSQTKEKLEKKPAEFGSKLEFSDKFLKHVVSKSGIVEEVLLYARNQGKMKLARAGGSKKKRVTGIHKLVDANQAGTKESAHCTLILTEGDSAKALAVAGMTVVGRDYYGVFPLRGKLLNVRDATPQQISKNEEITALMEIIGLKTNHVYNDASELRYGHIMIMADQDHDGSHIKGLIINMIHCFWPNLLQFSGFVTEFTTPIVKVSKDRTVMPFYSQPEYDEWRARTDSKGWHIKYYKGLGTSTAEEAREYFEDLARHKKDFVYKGSQDDEAIKMAFGKEKAPKGKKKSEEDGGEEGGEEDEMLGGADARKKWIEDYVPGTYLDHALSKVPLVDFVNKELVQFSIANCQRSIPCMLDGLKPGQRKILFCCFKRNLVRELKVAQLSGYVSENAAYHHGEVSLQTTIVNMAQNFVGSNNINLLHPQGQFGTRLEGGKDAASARYITSFLTPLARLVFHKADDAILDYLEDDGLSVEPKWYVPVIPLVLCNGNKGIGTGWSSTVPNYNPRDIVANVRRMLRDEVVVPMHPWYRGFLGKHEWDEAKQSYTVKGVWRKVDEQTLEVTELPVGKWTQVYKVFLEKSLEPAKEGLAPLIKDYKDYNTDTRVRFLITVPGLDAMSDEEVEKKFGLASSIRKTNMHFFNEHDKITKYEQPEQILREFYHIRLAYYHKRKAHQLAVLEAERDKFSAKVRFVEEVIKGDLVITNRPKKQLLEELARRGYKAIAPHSTNSKRTAASMGEAAATRDEDGGGEEEGVAEDEASYDYLLGMKMWSLTREYVAKLKAQRDAKEQELEDLKGRTVQELWESDLDAFEAGWLAFEEAMRLFDENQTAGKKFKMPATRKPPRKALAPRKKAKKDNDSDDEEDSGEESDKDDEDSDDYDAPSSQKLKAQAQAKEAPKKAVPAPKPATAQTQLKLTTATSTSSQSVLKPTVSTAPAVQSKKIVLKEEESEDDSDADLYKALGDKVANRRLSGTPVKEPVQLDLISDDDEDEDKKQKEQTKKEQEKKKEEKPAPKKQASSSSATAVKASAKVETDENDEKPAKAKAKAAEPVAKKRKIDSGAAMPIDLVDDDDDEEEEKLKVKKKAAAPKKAAPAPKKAAAAPTKGRGQKRKRDSDEDEDDEEGDDNDSGHGSEEDRDEDAMEVDGGGATAAAARTKRAVKPQKSYKEESSDDMDSDLYSSGDD